MELHALIAIAAFALIIPPALWLWDRHTGQNLNKDPDFQSGYNFGLSLAGQPAMRYIVAKGITLEQSRGEFTKNLYGCACAFAALDNKPRPRPWKQGKTTTIQQATL